MRIGVDSRPLRELKTSGIPMYVRSVLKELAEIDRTNEYILYAHKDFDFPVTNPKWSKKFGAKTNFGSVWMQVELPFWLKRDRVDIFWGTQHNLPLMMDSSIKAVLTILDLIHLVFPETMKLMNYLINKYTIPRSVSRANAVVAISKWTMRDVVKYLNPKNKIMEVTYMGVSQQFHPRDLAECQTKIKHILRLPVPYLLTVGTFEPRKNVRAVIKAFSNIADKIPHSLVIVGQKGWKNLNVLKEIGQSPLRNRIKLPGYISDDILPDVYGAADLFVFPSLYEGFGIPPLEAMASGTPVVASNVSSIPEVVGEAAHLVDPNLPGDISDGILKVINNGDYRENLIQRGLVQASQFTWSKTAHQMLDLFSRLNGNK